MKPQIKSVASFLVTVVNRYIIPFLFFMFSCSGTPQARTFFPLLKDTQRIVYKQPDADVIVCRTIPHAAENIISRRYRLQTRTSEYFTAPQHLQEVKRID